MKNLRIKIILIITLAVIIVIGALYFYQWLEKERQLAVLRGHFERCQNLENIRTNLADILPPIELDDPLASSVINNGSSLDCLGAHDIYFCNLISSEKEQTFCENSFYAFKALEENNLDYCEKAGERKFLCEAIFKKDESLCEKINPSLFFGEEIAKTFCKAVVREDVEECEKLDDKVIIQECKDSFYKTLAFIKRDVKFCDKISIKRIGRVQCKAVLDLNECLKYHSEVQCSEIYLPQIAQLTKDPSVCEGISYKDEDEKGEFLYRICVEKAK